VFGACLKAQVLAFTPGRMRHTVATELVNAGADIPGRRGRFSTSATGAPHVLPKRHSPWYASLMGSLVDCAYCTRLLGLARTTQEPWDLVLKDLSSFVVAPSKGALVEGWLLVVSKEHLLSSAAMSLTPRADLEAALKAATALVESRFGPATIFEHGPSQNGSPIGCGIDHMHLHVVPLTFSLRRAATSLEPGLGWQPLAGIHDVSTWSEGRRPYLLVQEPGDSVPWVSEAPPIRQFLRRAVASTLGTSEFDYSEYPQRTNVLNTVARLGGAPLNVYG